MATASCGETPSSTSRRDATVADRAWTAAFEGRISVREWRLCRRKRAARSLCRKTASQPTGRSDPRNSNPSLLNWAQRLWVVCAQLWVAFRSTETLAGEKRVPKPAELRSFTPPYPSPEMVAVRLEAKPESKNRIKVLLYIIYIEFYLENTRRNTLGFAAWGDMTWYDMRRIVRRCHRGKGSFWCRLARLDMKGWSPRLGCRKPWKPA